VSLRLSGRESDRCEVRLSVAVPPRDSVFTHEIDPLFFERLIGTPAERRGLDLTIAARISSLFSGVARLEAIPGQGTTIVLDWPATVPRPT
jgi:signal transduction histidine kinase